MAANIVKLFDFEKRPPAAGRLRRRVVGPVPLAIMSIPRQRAMVRIPDSRAVGAQIPFGRPYLRQIDDDTKILEWARILCPFRVARGRTGSPDPRRARWWGMIRQANRTGTTVGEALGKSLSIDRKLRTAAPVARMAGARS